MIRGKFANLMIGLILGFFMVATISYAFTYTWDETDPAGSDNPRSGDDEIREFKYGIRERLASDHYFLSSDDSTDTTIGYHKKATFMHQATTPTAVASTYIVYGQDVGGKTELWGIDEDSNAVKFTSAGKLTGTFIAVDDTSIEVSPASTVGNALSVKLAADPFIKGWVQFNGTGTLAIQDSFNVTSVTDNGTGDYTVNWGNNFADAKYAVIVSSSSNTTHLVALAAGTTRINTDDAAGNAEDAGIVCVIAIGTQ